MYPNNVEYKRPHLPILSPIILCKFENGSYLLNNMAPLCTVLLIILMKSVRVVKVVEYPDQKQLKEERANFGLEF